MKYLLTAALLLNSLLANAQAVRDDAFINVRAKEISAVTCSRTHVSARTLLISYWLDDGDTSLTSTVRVADIIDSNDGYLMLMLFKATNGDVESVASVSLKKCEELAAEQLKAIKDQPEALVRFYAPGGNIESFDIMTMTTYDRISFLKEGLKNRIRAFYSKLLSN